MGPEGMPVGHENHGVGCGCSRRDFFKKGLVGAVAASAAVASTGGVASAAEALSSSMSFGSVSRGVGLAPAGPELALLPGFSYTTFGRFGSAMSDGWITPPIHDGMGCFPDGPGQYRIVRNHETGDSNDNVGGTVLGNPRTAYDRNAPGGTTTMIVDDDGNLLDSFLSLNGSDSNCSGGTTPWGTWLSCEETVVGPTSGGGWSRKHGYIFEVDSAANKAKKRRPIVGMGRFLHEAASVDAKTGVVYMTEDEGPDGFYRFVPNVFGDYMAGGVLQALKIVGEPNYVTFRSHPDGTVLPAKWVTIAHPDGPDDDARIVYRQAQAKGAAKFLYGEGATQSGKSCIFNNNEGGATETGQILKYTPTKRRGQLDERGELTYVYESPGRGTLDTPDNLAMSPNGAVIMAEDGTYKQQFVRALLPDGTVFPIAENLVDVRLEILDASGKMYDPTVPDDDFGPNAGTGRSEFAGPCFSPDGKWLFVNIQVPGITCAITGDWDSIGL